VGEFNTPLSPIDRQSKPKTNKEILDLNNAIHQIELPDVCRIFHPTSAQYTFSQQSLESSPKLIISLGTTQESANIRKQK
jgi:hypothetical protein